MTAAKTILITGGTSGIGRETALLLAGQGHQVFIASRHAPGQPMPGVTYVPLDLSQPESIQACARQVLAQAGQIDVLVNNAGYVGPVGASEEVSMEEVRALFETNFFGMVQMVNAILPDMRRRRSGLIINLSSAAGIMAIPWFWSFYVASKHAIEGYSEGLANELHPRGIRVVIIEPGYFSTRLHTSSHLPPCPLAEFDREREHALAVDAFCVRQGRSPRLVAKLIARLVNGTPRRLRYPIGLDLKFILVVRRLLPSAAFETVMRLISVGGQPVKLGDDDTTISRKIGLLRFLLQSRLADRLLYGFLILMTVLVAAGLASGSWNLAAGAAIAGLVVWLVLG